MKTFLLVYIIGVLIAGIVYDCMLRIDGYYDYQISLIEEVKKKNSDYTIFDNEFIITSLMILQALMSWVGVVFVVLSILGYIGEKL